MRSLNDFCKPRSLRRLPSPVVLECRSFLSQYLKRGETEECFFLGVTRTGKKHHTKSEVEELHCSTVLKPVLPPLWNPHRDNVTLH